MSYLSTILVLKTLYVTTPWNVDINQAIVDNFTCALLLIWTFLTKTMEYLNKLGRYLISKFQIKVFRQNLCILHSILKFLKYGIS